MDTPKIPEDRASSWFVDEDGNWEEVPFLVVDVPCSDDFDSAGWDYVTTDHPLSKVVPPIGGTWSSSGEDDFTVKD